jgi:hypothetical protein
MPKKVLSEVKKAASASIQRPNMSFAPKQDLSRAIRERDAIFVFAALAIYSFLFWAGCFAMFGAPTSDLFYGELGSFLLILRIGWPVLDRWLPKS